MNRSLNIPSWAVWIAVMVALLTLGSLVLRKSGPEPKHNKSKISSTSSATNESRQQFVRNMPGRPSFGVPVPGEYEDVEDGNAAAVAALATADAEAASSDEAFSIGSTTGTVTSTNAALALRVRNGAPAFNDNQAASGGVVNRTGETANDQVQQTHNKQPGDMQNCTPGTVDCRWRDNDLVTYVQSSWGDPASKAGALLTENFKNVYTATAGVLEVGVTAPGSFTMQFKDADSVLAFLPQTGPIGALDANVVNPTATSSGAFGGEVVALALNIDFSKAKVTGGNASISLGDLTLCGLSTTSLNNLTVTEVLGIANKLLAGGSAHVTISKLYPVLQDLNASFAEGVASAFAQEHLFNGACPEAKPHRKP